MMLGIEDLVRSGAGLEGAACAVRMEQDAAPRDFVRVAEASAAMIWMADTRGLCTFANQRWLEIRGRTLDQELGTGWAEGIHPDDGPAALRDYGAAFHALVPLRIEYRVLCEDGAYHRVERLGSPWLGRGGEPRGYVGCVTLVPHDGAVDWDARRQLATLSHRERQVLELIALGHSTRQIAERLAISYKTADSHRTHLLKKLRIHETATLVRFAIRAGAVVA